MKLRNSIRSFAISFFLVSALTSIEAIQNIVNKSSSGNSSQLKLVHVVFAHKLFAPLKSGVKDGFPERLDYQYFLENTTDMPNDSKMELFNLGVFLRQRYGKLLGDIYYPEVMEMRSSEYFLSMISAQLVNAGLWPPHASQKWNDDLDWQPIPTEYEQKDKDTLLLGTLCPSFRTEEKLILEDKSIQALIAAHEPFFSSVTKNYGKNISHPSEIALLYSCLETMLARPNATLPAWAKDIFPNGEMLNMTLLSHDLLSKNLKQKQMNGGSIIKKIIQDSTEIRTAKNLNPGRNDSRDLKISLYSGEDRNIVGVLQALNLWTNPHIPENGAAIIFELRYDSAEDIYGFQILYYTGPENNKTIALSLPGCQVFCGLADFSNIVSSILPTDEKLMCHEASKPKDGKTRSSADSHRKPLCFSHILFLPFVALLLSKF